MSLVVAPCYKKAYGTKDAAARELESISRPAGQKQERRVYRCPFCGWWHLSSEGKQPRPGRRRG